MKDTTRRGLLGAIAVASVALAPVTASANIASTRSGWHALVERYHLTRAEWLSTVGLEDEATEVFKEASAVLPQEPQSPGSGLPDNILGMTIAEIKATGDTPEHKAAWERYKAEHAAWKIDRDALHEKIVGPAKARYNATYAAYASALNELTACRVTSIAELGEKIEIIKEDYDGGEIPSEYLADLLADVRHLAGEVQL